jgi:hypothetical protein
MHNIHHSIYSATRVRRFGLASAIGALSLLCATDVKAQLNSDFGARVGVEKRFLTGRSSAARDATFGPELRLDQHFALLPLVRAGFYGGYSLSLQNASLRHQLAVGAHVRGFVPLAIPSLKLHLGVGVGLLHVLSNVSVSDVSKLRHGNCLDVPIDFGVQYRIRKPFDIGAQVGTRFAAFCGGQAYSSGQGKDTFALSLAVSGSVEF